MDSEYKFWLGFWAIIGAAVIVLIISTVIYNMSYNIKYFEAWNNCVTAGGQPINQTMLGTEINTFTCVRN
jgi:hypothetical protein